MANPLGIVALCVGVIGAVSAIAAPFLARHRYQREAGRVREAGRIWLTYGISYECTAGLGLSIGAYALATNAQVRDILMVMFPVWSVAWLWLFFAARNLETHSRRNAGDED